MFLEMPITKLNFSEFAGFRELQQIKTKMSTIFVRFSFTFPWIAIVSSQLTRARARVTVEKKRAMIAIFTPLRCAMLKKMIVAMLAVASGGSAPSR